jgi:hypothetical protein
MKSPVPFLALLLLLDGCVSPATSPTSASPPAALTPPSPAPDKLAAKPLFRDPNYDGAADPTIIYNAADKKWYMFYTDRRANATELRGGVSWVHGTPIGIATSADGGASWQYLANATINYKDAVPEPTWWAPAVVEHNGLYHMYLTYVPGVFNDWGHPRTIIHLTSKDLLTWDYQSTLPLGQPYTMSGGVPPSVEGQVALSHTYSKVIDPGVLHLPDGTWRLWYKDEATGSSCDYADSSDLYTWTDHGKVPGLSDAGGEAPLPFHWHGHYWLMRDITGGKHGLALYRSDDALAWSRVGTLLQAPGTGPDDTAVGHHPEVILSGDRAYLFYFTQFGRRTSIQVTELHYDAPTNTLTVDRNSPTMINLQPPKDSETESKFN